MTVGELIYLLSAQPEEAKVCLKFDSACCERCGNWAGTLEDTACDVNLEPDGYILIST